tara:strand:+ start:122 stop:361 length:240 start_codon:yes stop_codon:yes gene_type:complete
MKEFINFEKNIFSMGIKLIVPAYILQTLWLIPWDSLEYLGFKAVVYGIIYWLVSLVLLRMACELFLLIFKALNKYISKD